MKLGNILRAIVYPLAFLLPIVILLSCGGLNTGFEYGSDQCAFRAVFLQQMAANIHYFIYVSVIIWYVPVILYAVVILVGTEIVALKLNRLRDIPTRIVSKVNESR